MKYGLSILATFAVLGLLGLVFPYTGFYNVAATEGHTGLEEWYLSTLSRRSIQSRAGEIEVPTSLADSGAVARGAMAYAQMCQTCHGGPGFERSVTGEGMTPTPPLLSETAPRWTSGEEFWIVQNGIKMAGMPAFGPTHSDEELWELVAFVEQLPNMTPDDYTALTAQPDTTSARPLADDGHDHVH